MSKFKIPDFDFLAFNVAINSNLDQITQRIFNPYIEIERPTFNKTLNHVDRNFNKFFKNLSCNNVSIMMFPLESLFITLSKINWNKTLKIAKIQKIAQICQALVKKKEIGFFEDPKDTVRIQNEQMLKNLENISDIYKELFKEFKKS